MPSNKNIWIAAGDDDIERVKALLEAGTDPNTKDPNSYTPLHAAASYGNHEMLRLLVKSGGDINITDDDGETPLFVVESVRDAQLVIELGGDPKHCNDEGVSAAEYHVDENPAIARYLSSITGIPVDLDDDDEEDDAKEEDASIDAASTALLNRFQQVMQDAQQTGQDPESALRQVVEDSVRGAAELGIARGSEQHEADVAKDAPKRRRDDPER